MKVNHNQISPGNLDAIQKNVTQTPAKENSMQEKTGPAAFNVSISRTAGQLARATDLISRSTGEDMVRYEKVAAIKDQLAAGTYTISGKDVAKKLLASLTG